MPGWLKLLLAIFGLLLVIVVVLSVVAYKAVQSHAPELKASADKARSEGAAFGAGKQPGDCVDAALERPDRTFTGQIRTRLFVDACLNAATPSAEFCAAVPGGIFDTAKWANAECIRRKRAGDQACVAIYTAVSDYCHRRK